jgi:DNA polymerase-1
VDVHPVLLDRPQPDIIRPSQHLSAFHARAGQEHAEAVGVVVPAVAAFAHRRPAEFAAPDDKRGIQQAALLQVHDELIFEAPEYENEKAIKNIIYVMENAAHPVVQIDVPLNVEAKSAMNWDDAH